MYVKYGLELFIKKYLLIIFMFRYACIGLLLIFKKINWYNL